MRRVLGVLLAGFLASVVPISLQAAPREQKYALDIPRQSLLFALQDFALRTGVYAGSFPDNSDDVNVTVGPLQGQYTIEEALTTLLGPVGLTHTWVSRHSIAIDVAKKSAAKKRGAGAAPASSSEDRSAQQPYSFSELPSNGFSGEVEVVRSYLHPAGMDLRPTLVVDESWIKARGVSTVPDVVKLLTQQPYSRGEGFRASGAQYAELRGLGVDTTLILINGRRTIPTATSLVVNAFDLNTIPLAAVERIEVLSDSASAVHGADAIGGVINIVLKDDIPHPVVDLNYGTADGGADERRATFSIGHSGEWLRGAVVMDYFQREFLLGAQRDRWNNQDYRRFGSVDQRSLNANPGNIASLTPANLPGLPSRFAAIPPGSSGVGMSPTDLLAGQFNRESLYRYWSAVPETDRFSISASGTADLGESLEGFGELLYVDRNNVYQTNPPRLTSTIVPASNAFNFLSVPIAISYLFEDILPRRQTTRSELFRAVAGLRGELDTWNWELSLVSTEENSSVRTVNNGVDAARLAAALASPDPTRALNVFQDGPGGSPELLASLITPPTVDHYATEASQATGIVRGSPFRLPAGAADMVIGGEWRQEDVRFDDLNFGARSRSTSAAFTELRLPLTRSAQAAEATGLSLTVAARLDSYADFGEVFNPQYGLVWRPLTDLMLRASYGTSFRPPSLFELFAPRIEGTSLVQDQRRNNEVVGVTFISGGNLDLEPTDARSFSAGFVLAPHVLPALRVSGSYWHIEMDRRITLIPFNVINANEAWFADRVLRAEPTPADVAAGLPGTLKQVDISRINFGRLQTSGIDFAASYNFETRFGSLAPSISATWVNEYTTVDLPATSPMDRVNLASPLGTIPRWRAVATLGWRLHALGLSLTARHTPSYDDANFVTGRTGRKVAAQTLVDMQASLDLDGFAGGHSALQGLQITAGMLNAFNEEAPFAESGLSAGFDWSQGDIRQRFGYLRLSKRF